MTRIAPQDHSPVIPEKRKAFSLIEVVQAMTFQHGRCSICGEELTYGYHADHILPLELGGKTELANLQLLCATPCHAIKTAHDIKRIAKARRIRNKPLAKPKRPIQGRGFDKSRTRHMDGSVGPRE